MLGSSSSSDSEIVEEEETKVEEVREQDS